MSKTESQQLDGDIQQAKADLDSAIQKLRSLLTTPLEVAYGPQITLVLQPADHDERVVIQRAGWGSTCVNYTSEGLILDVFADEQADEELVLTHSILSDELCGSDDSLPAVDLKKTVTMVVGAHATSDDVDSIVGALIKVDVSFMLRLESMQSSVILSEKITQLVCDESTTWLPHGVSDEMNFCSPELVVTRDSFWFVDRPLLAFSKVESKAISFSDLRAVFNGAADGEVVLLGDDDFKACVSDMVADLRAHNEPVVDDENRPD